MENREYKHSKYYMNRYTARSIFCIMSFFMTIFITCICSASESDLEYSRRLGRDAQESYSAGNYTEALLLAREAADVPDESVSAAAEYALQKVTDSYIAPVTSYYRGGEKPLTNLYPVGDFETESEILDYLVDDEEDILITVESSGKILCRDLFTHEVTNTLSIKPGEYGGIKHYNLSDGCHILVSPEEIVCFNCNGGEQIWNMSPLARYSSYRVSAYDVENKIFYVLESMNDAHLLMIDADTGEILDRRRLVYDTGSSLDSFPSDFDDMLLSEDSILLITYPDGGLFDSNIVLSYSLSTDTCTEIKSVEGIRKACAVDSLGRLITVSGLVDTDETFAYAIDLRYGATSSIAVTSQEQETGDVIWQIEFEYGRGEFVYCKTLEYIDGSEEKKEGVLIAAGDTTVLIDCETGELLSKIVWSSCVTGVDAQENEGFYVFLEDGTYDCTFYSWIFSEDNAEVYTKGLSDPLFDASVSSAGYIFKDRQYYVACSGNKKKIILKGGSVSDPSFKTLSPEPSAEEETYYLDVHPVLDDKLVCLKGSFSEYELTDLEVYDAKEGLLFSSSLRGFSGYIRYVATDKEGRHIFKDDHKNKIGILDIKGRKFAHFDITKDTYEDYCVSPGFYWTVDDDIITAETWETGEKEEYIIDGLRDMLGTDFMKVIAASGKDEYAWVSTSPYETDDIKYSIAIVDLSSEKASLIQTQPGKELVPWDKTCVYSDGICLAATNESAVLYDKSGKEVLDLGLYPESVASVYPKDEDLWILLCDGTIQRITLSEKCAITTYCLDREFSEYENYFWQIEDSFLCLTSATGLYVLDTVQGEQKLFIPGGAGYAAESECYYAISARQKYLSEDESDVVGVFPVSSISDLKEKAEKRTVGPALTARQKAYYYVREKAEPEEEKKESTPIEKISRDENPEMKGEAITGNGGNADSILQSKKTDIKASQKQNTVMIYMVGSNLESRYAAATRDLKEMRSSEVDFSKTNVIVFTGGSKRWNCNVKVDTNCVLDLSLSEDDWIVAESEESLNMGKAETLSAFVNYCAQNYPAEHFSLICWDHGAGSLLGYGNDELFGGDSLLLSEMKEAMQQTPFNRDNPLDMAGFDACLMGNLETAVICSEFARYMVGSEELEAGDGWDYHFLNAFNDASAPEKIAENILEMTGAYYQVDDSGRFGADVTLSCLDLSVTEEVCNALNALSLDMTKKFNSTMYANVRKATADVRRFGSGSLFGKASGGTQFLNSGYDQLDLLQYSRNLQDLYPKSANKLALAVRKMVVNQISTIEDIGGISFYFPGDNQELYKNMGKQGTSMRSFGEGYTELLSEIEEYWQNYKAVSSDLGAIKDKGDELTLTLPKDLKDHITKAYVFLFGKNDSSTYYYPCMRLTTVPDERGRIRLSKDMQVFGLKLRDGEFNLPCFFIQEALNGDAKEYTSILNLLAHCWSLESDIQTNVQVKISSSDNDDKIYIKDITEIDEGGNSNRNSVDIRPWQGISIVYTGYEVPDEEKAEFTPWYNWKRGTYRGYQLPLTSDIRFEKKKLSDYDSDFYIQIVAVTDYNVDYASDLVQIYHDNKEKEEEKNFPTEQGALVYRTEDGHAEIISYRGKDAILLLPDEIEGLPVTVIAKRAFAGNETIEEIVFPDSLVSVKNSAFRSCEELKKVTMNPRLKEIESEAFESCEKLEEVYFPDSPEFMGKHVFFECEALETIRTASETERGKMFVSGNAIYDDYGKTLLYYASGQKEPLVAEEGTETIGAAACWKAAVREIVLPETVKTIENGAFYGCELDTFELPESLEYIGIEAFGTPFMDDVFESTGKLSSVRLGKNVSFIGEKAFDYLRLKEFSVDEENTAFSSIGGLLCSKSGDVLLSVPSMRQWSVTIPEGVTRIAKSACAQNEEVLNYHMPESVKVIEDGAFKEYYSISGGGYPFTIYGKEGSYAEEYAQENNINFIAE